MSLSEENSASFILMTMENDLLTIKDLGNAVCAICESSQGIERHIASALNRIGYIIADVAEKVEADRIRAKDAAQ